MKKPNEFKSRKEWEDFLWDKLLVELSESKTKEKIEETLKKIIGNHERRLLLRRLTAMLLLQEGLNYREIGEILWLSPNTISTIKKNTTGERQHYRSRRKFPSRPKQYSPAIKLDIERKKQEITWKLIKEILNDINFPSGYRDMRKRWGFLSRW